MCFYVERKRRFIQQFTEKLPTMMYIWIGMHLHQLAGRGTLKRLIELAYLIFSTDELRNFKTERLKV